MASPGYVEQVSVFLPHFTASWQNTTHIRIPCSWDQISDLRFMHISAFHLVCFSSRCSNISLTHQTRILHFTLSVYFFPMQLCIQIHTQTFSFHSECIFLMQHHVSNLRFMNVLALFFFTFRVHIFPWCGTSCLSIPGVCGRLGDHKPSTTQTPLTSSFR